MASDRVSLQDVASAAGVALSTASNSLNDRGRVADATRLRVKEAAADLGYLPNPSARTLRAGRPRLIAVALRMYLDAPNVYPSDLYYGQLITASTATASERGYAVALLPERDITIADELPLAAVIVTDTAADDPVLEHAYTLGIPVVTDNRRGDSRASVVVDVDVAAAVGLANNHLTDSGARHIGLLSVRPKDTSFAEEWEHHHQLWCDENGHPVTIDGGHGGDLDRVSEAVHRLMDAGCDAVVALPIGSGPRIVEAARSRGKLVPRDFLVVVVDEDPALETEEPPITTVGLNPIGTAVQGTHLVIDVLEGKAASPAKLLMEPHLIIRRSSTPPPVRTTRS